MAIEVKIDKFDARDIGQLGTYVTAVNHILRDQQNDNPTIGLLICKSKDNTLAQYALEGYNLPLGIGLCSYRSFAPKQLNYFGAASLLFGCSDKSEFIAKVCLVDFW